MKHSMRKAAVFIFLFFSAAAAMAEEGGITLDKIVVTPYRYEEALGSTPSSITVIGQEEIGDSNAESVSDVFRTIPGMIVRDWYGNGTKAAVDIGGFGEQAAQNVLVLVDGRRVNDVDLSGVDWRQIPLDQVERIEVVQGGTAGVLYGDNASSGVINIITKKGSGKPKIESEFKYGSYDMNAQKVSLKGGIDNKFSYLLSAGRDGTHGYRNNSFDRNTDYSSNLAYNFTDTLSAHFASGFHAFTYGMPASLNQTVIDQYSRRYSRYGDDHTTGKDFYFLLGPKADFFNLGKFDFDFNYRFKNSDSYFLSSGLDSLRNKIETFGFTPKYTLGKQVFGRDNKLISGIDYYRYIYTSQTLYFSKTDPLNNGALNQYSDINKDSFGSYLQDEFSLFKPLILAAGYRYEFARYSFGYHDNDLHNYGQSPNQDNKVKLSTEAFNAGLVYTYREGSNAFFNVSRSFRFPEVDEFTYTDQNWQKQLDTGLKPQSSLNYQIGLRHKFFGRVRGELSGYRMDVKDEIYFNAKDFSSFGSWIGKNGNYSKTVHEGGQASLDMDLAKWLNLSGNYTFTKAYFNGGPYDDNDIPLVPMHKGSIGLRISLPKNVTFNMSGTYVGQRYFLNDQANAYSQLNGYAVADANLSWCAKDLTLSFGINNLFDRKYSEFAGVTVDNGVKFYYPSPERNFNFKLNYEF